MKEEKEDKEEEDEEEELWTLKNIIIITQRCAPLSETTKRTVTWSKRLFSILPGTDVEKKGADCGGETCGLLPGGRSGRSGSRCVRLCRTTGLRSSASSSLTPSQMLRTLHDESNISTGCPVRVPGKWTMGADGAVSPVTTTEEDIESNLSAGSPPSCPVEVLAVPACTCPDQQPTEPPAPAQHHDLPPEV
ncbi:hypothetical protein EYF80_037377 [Liparis tanakae]|uniref:Uncharacterized protein n=1 Tax=Liparis tanakae TaxID=230148 RepID=A0A4Z2GFW1_9TELE|nr:hypothetical protein EYF80_037377 [Liparis tanakae]